MKPLSPTTYQTLISGAEVLEADSHGPKVMRLADGNFLKLFRRKRLISSEALSPYAQRFANNAATLSRLNVPAPEVAAVYRLDSPDRTAVQYKGLPGITLRQAMKDANPPRRKELTTSLGRLLAQLHEAGVYFRSLHLGNVLLLPDQRLGLIDFADMRIERKRLSRWKRQRNLRHMQRYEEDRQWLFHENIDALKAGYTETSSIEDIF
ncbi:MULTISPECIES: lipopolysaccharide kinase InaA family protein [Pseudomonas]|uniref:lipopolysaccharide kinase InaA family protein n=1 Tax=Pseudomonas TaxID=286 RepID=UPI0025811480|nr:MULTISPECIES: lipopolysaccharide kinase InaA family protein [Pseudomonas]